ncbi:MAG: response regulator [Rhodospirillaceae bacterium]|nr:response regulator [Rhodospirillales bacterium]
MLDRIATAMTALLGLNRPAPAAQSPWRVLHHERIIEGYALWDAEDRLVEQSGFLGNYLPQLAEWQRPTGYQIVTALVESGRVTPLPGLDSAQTIETMCRLRGEIPGLRSFRMTDGQVFLARTLDMGESCRATIFSNITDFNKTQQSYRVHEDTFRDVFESAPSMMVLLDAAKRPLAVNRAFRTALGHPLDHLAELGWEGILHPDDNAAPWSAGTHRFVSSDGTVVRGQMRVTPVRNADGRLLVTIEDLTQRWDAEERIRLQALLLGQIGSAVLAVDRNGRVIYGNPAAQTLFQWSDAVLPGTPVERLLGPGIRAAMDSEITEIELEGATWSGSHFPAQAGIARMVDGAGNSAGVALVVSDLTPRRALDLQLMHSARLATLGEMAASIAHEFNQCLHVIRLASEALRMDLSDGALDPTRIGKRCTNILTQVDRLTEMVSHMRTISRRDNSGKRPFRPQGALDAAIRMMEPLLQVEGIALVRRGLLGHRNAMGHQVRLEQVLLNLLNNARDSIRERFARDGNTGGTITIACTAENGRLRIRLSDDGTGVLDTAGHHIFEPFFTTKDEGRGCGLGLSISRGICAEMGGSLTFRNLERGAEFTIEIPELAPSDTVETPPPAPEMPDMRWTGTPDDEDDFTEEHRLLLVDDEALSVMMVSEFLERQGYVVDTAYDGMEALDKCQTHVYHAVITDIRMPRMDGHELIARLDELQPGTPVIVVTGHLKESHVTELGANVVAMLSKPFQLQDLRDHLSRLDHIETLEKEEV